MSLVVTIINNDLTFFGVVLLIGLVLIGSIIVGFVIYGNVKKKRIDYVLSTSSKIKAIIGLNNKFSFYSIPSPVVLTRTCNSKKEFDRTDFSDFLTDCILDNHHYYRVLMGQVEDNL